MWNTLHSLHMYSMNIDDRQTQDSRCATTSTFIYQPVQYCTYCSVLGSFNNCNIIKFSHKSIYIENLDPSVLLCSISNNMAVLVQTGQYGAINTTDTTTMGYHSIKLFSEAYTIQQYTTCDRKLITAGELFI